MSEKKRRSAAELRNPFNVEVSGPTPVDADFLRRYSVDSGLIADEKEAASFRDAIHYFLQVFHAGAAGLGVRAEKLAGIERPHLTERSWDDLAGWGGFMGYYNDVQTQRYRYHDMRSFDPFGRAAYAMDKSGAMNLIKKSLPGLSPWSEPTLPKEVIEAVLKAVPSGVLLNLATSDEAGEWYKEPQYQAMVNIPAEFMVDMVNPLNEVIGLGIKGGAWAKNSMFWRAAGERLKAAGASTDDITRFLIREVEGAPVVNDSLITSMKEALDAGDTALFAAYGTASGGTAKGIFSQGLDKIAYLSHYKKAGSTHSPMMEDAFYKQLGVQRFVQQEMNDAVLASEPLRRTLGKMSHDELAAFVLASGSKDSLIAFQNKSYVQGLGHVESPLVAKAIEQMRQVVGFDSMARTKYWPEIKVRLIQETQDEIEGNLARYGATRGELAAIEKAMVGASPEDVLRMSKQQKLLAGEGGAIKKKIEGLLVRRDEIQASDAPRLMEHYSSRLKDMRDLDDTSDPMMALYREYAVPGYNMRRVDGREVQEILDGYGRQTETLRADLIKMYDGVSARAAREVGEARYARILDGVEESIATVDRLALSEAPGSEGRFLLDAQRRSLVAFRAEALARVERHVRPAHGQRTAAEQITGQPGNWFTFQRKLAASRRELGRASEVVRVAQQEYDELVAVGKNLDDGTAIEAARAQLSKAQDRFTRAVENSRAVSERVAQVKEQLYGLISLKTTRSEQGKLAMKAAIDEHNAGKKAISEKYAALEASKKEGRKLLDAAWAEAKTETKSLEDYSAAVWASVPAERRAANKALWDKRIAATAKTEEKLAVAELDVKGGLQQAELLNLRKREVFQDIEVAQMHLSDAITAGNRPLQDDLRDTIRLLRNEAANLDADIFATRRVLDHASEVQMKLRTKLKADRQKAVLAFEKNADASGRALSQKLEALKDTVAAKRAATREKPALLSAKLDAEHRAARAEIDALTEANRSKSKAAFAAADELRKAPDLTAAIERKQAVVKGAEQVLKEKRAAVSDAANKVTALKKDISELGAGVASARRNSSAAYLRLKGAIEAEKEASGRAKLLVAPTPGTAMKVADDLFSVWDGFTNIMKRTVLFTPLGRFIVKNFDNAVKAFVEVGPGHTYRGVNALGEKHLIIPRQSFAGDAVRADPRANPGLVERTVSAAQEKFPLPTKFQQDIIQVEERIPREMIFDKRYWEKIDELKATGITDVKAAHPLANAYAEKAVDDVQFLGRPLGLGARMVERMFPFAGTYGIPSMKYAVRGIVERPAYTHAVINLQEAMESAFVSPDGKIEVADGHRVDPMFFVGLSQTMQFFDKIKFSGSFPFVAARPTVDEYEPAAVAGSVVTDSPEDRMQLSARVGALASVRGVPLRPHPAITLGRQLAAEPSTKARAWENFTRATVGMPADLALKVAQRPGGIGEMFFKLRTDDPENTQLYFRRQRDEIMTEFIRRGEPLTESEADSMLVFRGAMQAWGYIAGTDNRVMTIQGAELAKAKEMWFKLPPSARGYLYDSNKFPEAKLWGKYTREEREAKLDVFGDEKEPSKVLDMYNGANPAEKKTLLRLYFDKIMNALPESGKDDGANIKAQGLMEALAGTKMGIIARELFPVSEAAAADRARVVDVNRAPDPDERKKFLDLAISLTSEEAVIKSFIRETAPADPVAAEATMRAVLAQNRRKSPALIVAANQTTAGDAPIPLGRTSIPGGVVNNFSFYTTPDLSAYPAVSRAATQFALMAAETNVQSRWQGLSMRFDEYVRVGQKADFDSLRTDPRTKEFFDKNHPNYGADLLEEKMRLSRTGPRDPELSAFIKFGVLPYAYEKRAAEEMEARYPELGKFKGMLEDSTRPGPAQADRLDKAIAFGEQAVAAGVLPPDVYRVLDESPIHKDLYQRVERAALARSSQGVWDFIAAKQHGKVVGVDPVALTEIASMPKYAAFRPILQHLASGDAGDYEARAIGTALVGMEQVDPLVAAAVLSNIKASPEELAAIKAGNFEAMTGRSQPDYAAAVNSIIGAIGQGGYASPEAARPPERVSAASIGESVPAVSQATYGPAGTKVSLPPLNLSQGIPSFGGAGRAPTVPPARDGITQYNSGYTGGTSSRIYTPAALSIASWNNYSEARASWSKLPPLQRDFVPEPSFSKSIGDTWRGMANPDGSVSAAQIRTGAAGVEMAYGLANTAMVLSGEEMPAEANASMAGFSAGMSMMMMLGGPANPAGIAVGAVVGIATGLAAMKGRKSGPSFDQREANRINQERLNLERERYAESLKQQSIRDLRTRESDLARAIGGFTPQQRAQVGEQLAKFQRRPTYQSRIGLVDAAERAVGSAIKPRY